MQLQPKHPPSRKRRKLHPFAAEIQRLRAEGYTCEEICTALADVGLSVSRSTVQREALRGSRQASMAPGSTASAITLPNPTPAPSASLTPADRAPGPSPARPPAEDHRTPRQIADDFMQGQFTNPLLRNERTST